MKKVIATVIETNEYEIEIDVENDATEDEIWDAVKEAYLEDDYNNVDSHYDITITKIVGEQIMELIDKNALSMELTNEVLNAYAKADFRFAHALNVFQGLIDKAPIVEERKQGYWIDVDLDTSICSI